MRRADPYGGPWYAGMAAGEVGRAVVVVLARRAARPAAGDLSVHRQQSRRSRRGEAPARRRYHRTYDAPDQRRQITARTARDRATARRIFRRRWARSPPARAPGARN